MRVSSHTPPLGFAVLTPMYDSAIRLMTREHAWRRRLVELLDAKTGEKIIDVGAGTGSLAIAVTEATPDCDYQGIDPDQAAITIARHKAASAASPATFKVGIFGEFASPASADKIVSSLVLHQVALSEKRRLLAQMFECLKPGGRLFIADYNDQRTVAMRFAFRATVQLLDGIRDTQPNADGAIPSLIEEAGFSRTTLLDEFVTPTGRIQILSAEKPCIQSERGS